MENPPGVARSQPHRNALAQAKAFPSKHRKTENKGRVNGIERFWSERVDAENCTKYIGHLHKVLPIVVERKGRALETSSWLHTEKRLL